jgi:hypothetical protein
MTRTNIEPYAVRLSWNMTTGLSGREWEDFFRHFLEHIAAECLRAGSPLIGHIKGLVLEEDGHYLKISVTSTDHPADTDGMLPNDLKKVSLTLNVLVYGVPEKTVAKIVLEAAKDKALQHMGTVSIAAAAHKSAHCS